MEYLFLKRKKASFVSQRQKDLLFDAAEKQWRKEFVAGGIETRKVDLDIYKSLLYFLEIKQVFLDPKLSLKKLSMMIETNQTYLSNVINRYFGCCLKKLVNSYRIEYAKELLRAGNCPLSIIWFTSFMLCVMRTRSSVEMVPSSFHSGMSSLKS